jgi:hypothetical protein
VNDLRPACFQLRFGPGDDREGLFVELALALNADAYGTLH